MKTSTSYPSFTDENANVVLVSSGGVRFPVSASILSFASFIFDDLFHGSYTSISIQNCNPKGGPSLDVDVRGVKFVLYERMHGADPSTCKLFIKIGEDNRTLDSMLRMIYPLHSAPTEVQSPKSADRMHDVLLAGLKYEMALVVQTSSSALVKFAIKTSTHKTPSPALRLYAIACKDDLKTLMSQAARACLFGEIEGVYIPELEDISAGAHYRLLDYQQRVASSVRKELLKWIEVAKGDKPYRSYCGCGSNRHRMLDGWLDEFYEHASEVIRKAPLSPAIFDQFRNLVQVAMRGPAAKRLGNNATLYEIIHQASTPPRTCQTCIKVLVEMYVCEEADLRKRLEMAADAVPLDSK